MEPYQPLRRDFILRGIDNYYRNRLLWQMFRTKEMTRSWLLDPKLRKVWIVRNFCNSARGNDEFTIKITVSLQKVCIVQKLLQQCTGHLIMSQSELETVKSVLSEVVSAMDRKIDSNLTLMTALGSAMACRWHAAAAQTTRQFIEGHNKALKGRIGRGGLLKYYS